MQDSGPLQGKSPWQRGAGTLSSSRRLAVGRDEAPSSLVTEGKAEYGNVWVDWTAEMEALASCSQPLCFAGSLWYGIASRPCCAKVPIYLCSNFFCSLSRPCISLTDLFTCLCLPLNWHLFNRSGYLRISRHSSVFGKNEVEEMTVTSVQRIYVTTTQTCSRKGK